MKRSIFLVLLAAGLLSSPSAPQADGEVTELVVLEEQEPQTTLPLTARTMSEQRLSELLFDRLFVEGRGGDVESRVLEPGWSARPPNLTVTLRDGLMFSDGTPASFADLAFTVNDVYRRADVGHGFGAWYARVFGDAQQITPTTGSLRFQVQMPESGAERYLLTTALLSRASLSQGERVDLERSKRQPVGTGPFHAAAPIENFDDVRLVRNPHRPLSAAVTEKADRAPIGAMRLLYDQDAARQKELMDGSRADLWVSPPPSVIPDFKNQSERFGVRGYDLNQWWYVALDPADPQLALPQVREALDLALRREQLVSKFGAEAARPTSGPFLPGSAWSPADVAPTGHDVERARALLEEAGFVREGGAWVRDGEALALKLGVQADLLDDFNDVVYGVIDGWEDLGVRVRVRGIRPADWSNQVERGKASGEYDAILGRWNLDREEAALELFRAPSGDGPRTNLFGWSSPEADGLLKDFYAESSGPKREALMQTFHRTMHAQRPYLFLWTVQVQSVVRRDKVVGFRPAPFYYFTHIDQAAWKKAE